MDYRCPPQIQQVLPLAQIAGAVALPLANVCQAMFHRHPLAQLGPPLRRQLPLTQLLQQALVHMNADAPPRLAACTTLTQGAATTSLGTKLDVSANSERHHHSIRTAYFLPLP